MEIGAFKVAVSEEKIPSMSVHLKPFCVFSFNLILSMCVCLSSGYETESCRNFQGSTCQVVSLRYKGTIPKVSQSRNLCAGMLHPPLLCVFALFGHMLFALRLAPVKFDLLLVLERVMGPRGEGGRGEGLAAYLS